MVCFIGLLPATKDDDFSRNANITIGVGVIATFRRRRSLAGAGAFALATKKPKLFRGQIFDKSMEDLRIYQFAR